MSLAEWAEQFGRAEMFSALSKRAQGRNNESFPSEGNGDGDGGNQGMEALVEGEGGERRGLDEGGRPLDARNRGTAATDHAGMFVEELRVRRTGHRTPTGRGIQSSRGGSAGVVGWGVARGKTTEERRDGGRSAGSRFLLPECLCRIFC